MNGTQTDLPLSGLAESQAGRGGWSWRRMISLILFAWLIHVAIIFSLGAKKKPAPRAVENVPHLYLASASDELIALENPALFTLPNPRDFAAAIWSKTTPVALPSFNWSDKPHWLPLSEKGLGTTFSQLMQIKAFAMSPLNFKALPQFTLPGTAMTQMTQIASTLEISPSLAARQLVYQPALPLLSRNDVVPPSRVRVVVDDSGTVISSILLPLESSLESASSPDDANTNAVVLARSLRFKPAATLTFGEVTFYWHAVPLVSTNSQ